MKKKPNYIGLGLLMLTPPLYYLYHKDIYDYSRRYLNLETKRKDKEFVDGKPEQKPSRI